MLALWSGLFAGGLHAVSGPDHLAALGPLVLRRPQRSTGVGASWGAGHGAGLLLLALIVLGARVALPLDTIAWWAELAVGVWLMAMGAYAWRARPSRDGHGHGHPASPTPVTPRAQRTAFAVGLLHGATGAGHVVGVLPSFGLSRADAVSYMVGYALAAIIAMSLLGSLLGRVALRTSPSGLHQLRRACAGLAVVVGVFWIGQALTLAL